ncbi:MAG: hypothetical protein U0Q11_12545 [Vicinamibacterales bacterium]
MNETLEKIRTISNRLAKCLGVLVVLFVPGAFYVYLRPGNHLTSPPMAAFMVGIIGGFVGLQRRLKKMSDDDLTLLANSWVYVCLSPLVGGILAVLIYVLFVSGLLAGDLFPTFVPDQGSESVVGISSIFAIHGGPGDYGKMLVWCFIAGFSERFATDIISRFETQANTSDEPRS